MKALVISTENNLGKFGLNPDIKNVQNNFIALKAANVDANRYEVNKFSDLTQDLNDFLRKFDNQKIFLFYWVHQPLGKALYCKLNTWNV